MIVMRAESNCLLPIPVRLYPLLYPQTPSKYWQGTGFTSGNVYANRQRNVLNRAEPKMASLAIDYLPNVW
jgi:hypothetical protein